jgi:hypothetical protein
MGSRIFIVEPQNGADLAGSIRARAADPDLRSVFVTNAQPVPSRYSSGLRLAGWQMLFLLRFCCMRSRHRTSVAILIARSAGAVDDAQAKSSRAVHGDEGDATQAVCFAGRQRLRGLEIFLAKADFQISATTLWR